MLHPRTILAIALLASTSLAQPAKVYRVNSNGGGPLHEFDVATGVWSTKASVPSSNYTSIASDGNEVYVLPSNGQVYRYDEPTNTFVFVQTGPGGPVGSPIAFFEIYDGEFYWGNDGSSTMYYTVGGVWQSVSTPRTVSSGADFDSTTDRICIRHYGQLGLFCYDTVAGTFTITCDDPTSVGENSRVGVFCDGDYYTREWSGSMHKFDPSSCSVVDTGVTPSSFHSSTAAGGGLIYLNGYSGSEGTFEAFDPVALTIIPLANAPIYGGNAHPSLAFVGSTTPAAIRTVSTAASSVAPGQTGVAVSFDVENTGMSTFDVNALDLLFEDAGGMDVSSEYVVTPDPGNPTLVTSGATENFDFSVDVLPGATLGTITIDGTIDVTDRGTLLLSTDTGADVTDSWDVMGAVPVIRTIDAVPARVAPGSLGYQVSMDVENVGRNDLDVVNADLGFFDAGMVDLTSEYVVSPDPGNPTSIAVGVTETFVFSVDLSAMATLGTITVDGEIETIDVVSMGTVGDTGADTPDTWDVIGANPLVRTVDAPSATVAPGGSGYAVTVDIENTGLNSALLVALQLTFMGAMDRSAEYTVTPAPGNPGGIAPGATERFSFSVAVDLGATFETITIDAGFSGVDLTTGRSVVDIDADVTDSWDVVMCGATLCGDCTGDGQITILDALAGAQHAAGLITLSGTDFTNCNVTGAVEPDPGAAVTILDALTIAQFAAGLPAVLTCC